MCWLRSASTRCDRELAVEVWRGTLPSYTGPTLAVDVRREHCHPELAAEANGAEEEEEEVEGGGGGGGRQNPTTLT